MSTVTFAVGYTISRLTLLVMYWRARIHVPETRDLVSGYLVGFGLGALIWVASVFTPEPGRYVLWAVALTAISRQVCDPTGLPDLRRGWWCRRCGRLMAPMSCLGPHSRHSGRSRAHR